MSETWYPMINYEACIECGACVEKCSNGVYDKDKAPRPVVAFPEGCIQGCTGCGSLCSVDAIEYFGKDQESSSDGCGCNGGCNCSDDKDENKTKSSCGCSSDSKCC